MANDIEIAHPHQAAKPTLIRGAAAEMCLLVVFDHYLPSEPTFAGLANGMWGNISLNALEGRVESKGLHLEVSLCGQEAQAERTLAELSKVLNRPVQLTLDDGSEISAGFGNLRNHGYHGSASGRVHHGTAELWNWQHGAVDAASIWVGQIQGVAFRMGNMTLRDGGNSRSPVTHDGLRLEGNYNWHLVRPDKDSPYVAVIDSGNVPVRWDVVRSDVRALEFSLGMPLALNTLSGFDSNLKRVAGMGLALGYGQQRDRSVSDGPVPDRYDAERWRPVLFSKLARYLVGPNDISLGLAIGAYLDTKRDHIDGAYLKTQIALEATCAQFPRNEGHTVLVKEPKDWLQWVAANEGPISQHAINAQTATTLLNKVRSAQHAPSSRTVEDALGHLKLQVPQDIIREVRERGTVAHRYTMNKTTDRDIQKDRYRLDRLLTLLTAIVARVIRYEGPITGWARDANGWPIDPEWWPKPASADVADALVSFLFERKQDTGYKAPSND